MTFDIMQAILVYLTSSCSSMVSISYNKQGCCESYYQRQLLPVSM
jgi:uncharacterized protein YceK